MDTSVNEVISNENKFDLRITKYVMLFYVIEALNKSIKVVFPISDSMWQAMSNGFMIVLMILMLFTIAPVIKRSSKLFILFEVLFIVVYLLSFLQGNAETTFLLKSARQTICVCIPLAMYVYSIKDLNVLYYSCIKVSYLLIVILAISLGMMSLKEDAIYNMSLSYSLLLPTLFQFNYYIKFRKPINLLFFALGCCSILFFGARGPLLCIVYCIFLNMFLECKSILKKIILILVTILITCFLYDFSSTIVNVLLKILEGQGIYSRTLVTLQQGTVSVSLSREILNNYYFRLISIKPFFGWGLLGGWIDPANGPHNMLIEFILSFGIFGGLLPSFFSISLMFKVIIVKKTVLKDLLIIFSSYNFIMFFVMGNFHEKFNFFIFIALCLLKNNAKKLDKGKEYRLKKV